jgi:hypothetical protein
MSHRVSPLVLVLFAACTPPPAQATAPGQVEGCHERLASRPRSDSVTARSSAEITGPRVAFERAGRRLVFDREELLARVAKDRARCGTESSESHSRACLDDLAEVDAALAALRSADPAEAEVVLPLAESKGNYPDNLEIIVADLLESSRFRIVDVSGRSHTTLLLQRYSDGAGQRQFHLDDAECDMVFRIFDWVQ